MHDKCANCPLVGGHADVACPARTLPFPRYCRWMDPADSAHQPHGGRAILIMAGVTTGEESRIDGPVELNYPATADAPSPDRVRAILDSIPLAGDVVARVAKVVGADRLARKWEEWTGSPCNCPERQAKLNRATERLKKWAWWLMRGER